MTYEEYTQAIDWLFALAPSYQKDGVKAYKPGLENIIKLCNFFDNPQNKIKTVHIGGTNGKGSVSNMLSSILQEAGYKVGVYNSPHLVDFTERIKINGEHVNKEFVFDFIQKLKKLPPDIQPSFFEFTTIMGFEYFSKMNVDVAIIEVGLGGRLDSTNIITPLVSAITSISLDHVDILGETIQEIAHEKAGIIKNGIPIICGDEKVSVKDVIRNKALVANSEFIDATFNYEYFDSDLKGNYQEKNKKVVFELINVLEKNHFLVTQKNRIDGFLKVGKNTNFIGRWYTYSENPLVICDTGHNYDGLKSVFEQLKAIKCNKHIILGFVQEKKIEEVLEMLPLEYNYYFVKPSVNRGRSPKEYEDLLKKYNINYKIFDHVSEGYLFAKQNVKKEDLIFIGGSNFVVGDFLEKNL